jgi:hypothetical protein
VVISSSRACRNRLGGGQADNPSVSLPTLGIDAGDTLQGEQLRRWVAKVEGAGEDGQHGQLGGQGVLRCGSTVRPDHYRPQDKAGVSGGDRPGASASCFRAQRDHDQSGVALVLDSGDGDVGGPCPALRLARRVLLHLDDHGQLPVGARVQRDQIGAQLRGLG